MGITVRGVSDATTARPPRCGSARTSHVPGGGVTSVWAAPSATQEGGGTNATPRWGSSNCRFATAQARIWRASGLSLTRPNRTMPAPLAARTRPRPAISQGTSQLPASHPTSPRRNAKADATTKKASRGACCAKRIPATTMRDNAARVRRRRAIRRPGSHPRTRSSPTASRERAIWRQGTASMAGFQRWGNNAQ